METILLAIKPEYAEKIFSGTKKYEFRKRLANKPVNKIIIYVTEPLMQIIGEVNVLKTISGSPTSIWETTKKSSGICRMKYRDYFKGCKIAHVYCLGTIKRYNRPKRLTELNIIQPPQSFIYLTDTQMDIINQS